MSLPSWIELTRTIERADRQLQRNPNDEWSLNEKAQASYLLGLSGYADPSAQYSIAVFCWQRLLEINPTSKSALCDLGAALEKLGRFEEAIACYNRVVKIDPMSEGGFLHQIATGQRLSAYRGKVRIGGKDVPR